MSAAARIEERAAHWLVKRETEGWSVEDAAALEAWLEEATAHRVAYLRLEQGWRKVRRLAALKAPTPPRRRTPPLLSLWRPATAAAGIAAVLITGSLMLQGGHLGAKAYVTEIGGHQTVPLADGSKVELNTATRLRTEVDADRRVVWLDRGEAYFEVAHDPSRPFTVVAGDRKVTVLGTKFSVRRSGDQVQVAVMEGKVRVDPVKPAKAEKTTVITRGDLAIAKGPSILVVAKSVEKVGEGLSWRRGMLTFDQSTLGNAAVEFNRYNRKKLVIADADAAAVRIGGSFEATNVEAFARLLEQGFGLAVVQDGDVIKISR